jgi:hypothetical protein
MRRHKPKETLLERVQFEAKTKDGGGTLSFEAWGYEQDWKAMVTRYSMAYINLALYRGDHGRVLGYDNAHGEHHRHWMGKTEAVEFSSYEALVARFQAEWRNLAKRRRRHR